MRHLSEQDRHIAKILPADTVQVFLEEVADITESLCNSSFPPDPAERELAILSFVEAQAKRNLLLRLITDSENARTNSPS